MQKVIILLCCFLFNAVITSAQPIILNGYLKDSLTQLPIVNGTLSNSSQKTKASTDFQGFFRLVVSPNDLLYALAPHYRYDTLRYALLFQDTITIFLSPVDVMENITVETGYRRYQTDSLQRRATFEENRGAAMNMIDKSPKKTFGLVINLDRVFKSKHKNTGKQEQLFSIGEQRAYVNFRFSQQIVAYYTGLKGDELLMFMRLYTPSYEWLREHAHREHLIDYLSDKLQTFRRRSQ